MPLMWIDTTLHLAPSQEEFLHLIANLLYVTGVMSKRQQHEVLHTIGVYQQLAAYLRALFSQQNCSNTCQNIRATSVHPTDNKL
jgi:hypothetical protein